MYLYIAPNLKCRVQPTTQRNLRRAVQLLTKPAKNGLILTKRRKEGTNLGTRVRESSWAAGHRLDCGKLGQDAVENSTAYLHEPDSMNPLTFTKKSTRLCRTLDVQTSWRQPSTREIKLGAEHRELHPQERNQCQDSFSSVCSILRRPCECFTWLANV
jgi:hypothetical protein